MPNIDAAKLENFVANIFVRISCSSAEGARIGKYLVGANLTGHDSHGVARVPRYVKWKQDGLLIADQTVKHVIDTPALTILDGQFGFGQTIAPQAVQIGVEKCRAMGLAAVGLRHSGHVGRVGEWAEMAAQAGVVSIHFVNVAGSVLVAPFGGVDRRFSTAPVCIGIPRAGQDPVILDFATSLVAEGKALVASLGGKPLPHDALIGPDGAVSGDPKLLYGDYGTSLARDNTRGPGAIRAFGEHKGSGLALMCELLGGALTGNGASQLETRWSQGMFSIYVDPAKADPEAFFPAEVTRFLDFVKSARPAREDEPVLVPGEPELRMRKSRLVHGIPLPDDTLSALNATAKSVGLDQPLM